MRYFLVVFTAITKTGGICNGSSTMTVANNGYVNNSEFRRSISKEQGVTDVVISNIVELTQKDYNDFTL